MFARFFLELREAKVPVSLREYLTLMEAMKHGVARLQHRRILLSRARRAGEGRAQSRPVRPRLRPLLQGHRERRPTPVPRLPEEWLRKLAEKLLTDEEKAQIEALGGWEKLMETLRQRLAEQKGRHQGGSKWIGTAGTSPFGAYGYNPEGVRIGQDESRNSRARQGLGQARVQQSRRHASSSARATSSWRCGGCANSRARARPTSSISTARSARPRTTPAGSTSSWCRSGTTR